jgi:hypothetical protein
LFTKSINFTKEKLQKKTVRLKDKKSSSLYGIDVPEKKILSRQAFGYVRWGK